jgi:hypothetical protein
MLTSPHLKANEFRPNIFIYDASLPYCKRQVGVYGMHADKNKPTFNYRNDEAIPGIGSGRKLRQPVGIALILILVTGLLMGCQIFNIDNVRPAVNSETGNTSLPSNETQGLDKSQAAQLENAEVLPTSTPTPQTPEWSEIDAGDGPTLTWRPANISGVHQSNYQNPGLYGFGGPLLFDGERFYLLSNNGVFASSDGESWSDTGFRLPGTGASWVDVAAWKGMMVVATALPEILTWDRESDSTFQFSPPISQDGNTDILSAVAVGPQGALVVYFRRHMSSMYVEAAFISSNGRDWTEVNADPFNSGQFGSVVAFNDGFLYRQRSGAFWYSGDGHTWAEWFPDSPAGQERIPTGMTVWEGSVLAHPDSAFTGPSISMGPYSLLRADGMHQLPESGLPPLEGTYIGWGGEISAGPIGIVTAFGWDPHVLTEQWNYGCCEEGQSIGVTEFSTDGVNWTRRLLPEEINFVQGLAAGSDRVLMLGFSWDHNPEPVLWIGFPESN